MIAVDVLLYKIDQKLNKLASNEHQMIQLEDKILALNEAQIQLIKNKVDGNPSGMGLDSFRKRYEDIQSLIENHIDHPLPLSLHDAITNQWVADVHALSPTYMFYIDSYVLASKGRCENRTIWVNNDLAKHSDISILLTNNNYKPSFEYQETFSVVSSDQVSVYTDGTFIPSKIYIMYIRYPQYIDKTGYIKFDGTNSIDVDCELEAYMEDELLDLTVKHLAMYTENGMAMQNAQLRIQTNE